MPAVTHESSEHLELNQVLSTRFFPSVIFRDINYLVKDVFPSSRQARGPLELLLLAVRSLVDAT